MNALRDPSLWGVVAGNVFAMALALTDHWSLTEILWTYWAQSVLIGIINAYRMLTLDRFSVENVISNGDQLKETKEAKYQMTGFFVVHYGFFHLGYAAFLWQDMPLSYLSTMGVVSLLLGISGFITAHAYSYRHNRRRDFNGNKPNIGHLMFYPYLRIIPMHIIIVAGLAADPQGMLPFMIMKTIADGVMHIAERKLFRRNRI